MTDQIRDEKPAKSRREFLKLTAAGGVAFSLGAQTVRRPNFVFFLVDDLGWADLSCYGSKFHRSPNVDRLAVRGVRFTQAYAACPVCSPTRASIMTGRYPARTGVTNFIPGLHRYAHSKLNVPVSGQQLELEEVTIAEELKAAGYRTGHIGKWHLGSQGHLPQDQGFDENVGGAEIGAPKSFFYPQWENRPPVDAKQGEYLTDRLARSAEEFLEAHRSEPFFLYFPFYNVHIPLEGKPDYVQQFEGKAYPQAPQKNPVYAAMIRSMDEAVGRVTRKLEELGIADNTVIIFFSDNGGLHIPEYRCQIATSNSPLREGKGHLYEGGIREPCIIVWPGVTQPGTVSDAPIVSTDFYPTIADIAGIRQLKGAPVDGVNLVPLLKGKALKPRALYWHYPHYSNQGGPPGGAIRDGRLKLIEFYEGRLELYDIESDSGETRDLASAQPRLANHLQGKLAAWRQAVGAAMPTRNENWIPGREWEENPWMRNCPKS